MAEHPINGEEDAITLSPEQMEMVREAEKSFERGEGYTLEQARDIARKRTLVWMKKPSQSA